MTKNDKQAQGGYDAKIGNLLLQRKKKFLPKYRNLYNFRTINLHELYKFTAVHHNIPKETKTEHDKDVLT